MIRKRPSDPGFHPSKDEPHWAGDTTAEGQGVLFDLGEGAARSTMFGSQGGWDANTDEPIAPRNSSRLVPPPDNLGLQSLVKELGTKTQVPVEHWRMGRGYINLTDEGVGEGFAGVYHEAWKGESPKIGITKRFGGNKAETLVHEMGHAHHYDQPMIGGWSERGNATRDYRSQHSGGSPDPLKEAVADAYVDRYGGSVSPHARMAKANQANEDFAKEHDMGPIAPEDVQFKPYEHISNRQFGYSSQYEVEHGATSVWDDPDRVLYAGVRSHFDATGEIPHYQRSPTAETSQGGRYTYHGSPGSSTDATIAMLHEHSEHARAAWSNLTIGSEKGPKRAMVDVAADAVRRHKDRQLVTQGQEIQESLWGEPELARNQHGERPRTKAEVNNTLGNEPYAPNRLNVDS